MKTILLTALGTVTLAAFACVACHKEDADTAAPWAAATPAPSGSAPDAESAESVAAKTRFDTTVRPLLRQHCVPCHESTIHPFHASASLDTAYSEVMAFGLVDFSTPKNSRFYTRLAVDNHYCWNGDCPASAQAMLDALTAFVSGAGDASTPQGPPRTTAPSDPVPSDVTSGSPSDTTLNADATELKFTMLTPPAGAVIFAVNIEKFDRYSYRLFNPKVYAPTGVKVTAKQLLFVVNDALRPDGTYTQIDKTVDGQGPTTAVPLDSSTMILLMDKGPGSDRIAPSFAAFTAQ